jgi:hypothetical protein
MELSGQPQWAKELSVVLLGVREENSPPVLVIEQYLRSAAGLIDSLSGSQQLRLVSHVSVPDWTNALNEAVRQLREADPALPTTPAERLWSEALSLAAEDIDSVARAFKLLAALHPDKTRLYRDRYAKLRDPSGPTPMASPRYITLASPRLPRTEREASVPLMSPVRVRPSTASTVVRRRPRSALRASEQTLWARLTAECPPQNAPALWPIAPFRRSEQFREGDPLRGFGVRTTPSEFVVVNMGRVFRANTVGLRKRRRVARVPPLSPERDQDPGGGHEDDDSLCTDDEEAPDDEQYSPKGKKQDEYSDYEDDEQYSPKEKKRDEDSDYGDDRFEEMKSPVPVVKLLDDTMLDKYLSGLASSQPKGRSRPSTAKSTGAAEALPLEAWDPSVRVRRAGLTEWYRTKCGHADSPAAPMDVPTAAAHAFMEHHSGASTPWEVEDLWAFVTLSKLLGGTTEACCEAARVLRSPAPVAAALALVSDRMDVPDPIDSLLDPASERARAFFEATQPRLAAQPLSTRGFETRPPDPGEQQSLDRAFEELNSAAHHDSFFVLVKPLHTSPVRSLPVLQPPPDPRKTASVYKSGPAGKRPPKPRPSSEAHASSTSALPTHAKAPRSTARTSAKAPRPKSAARPRSAMQRRASHSAIVERARRVYGSKLPRIDKIRTSRLTQAPVTPSAVEGEERLPVFAESDARPRSHGALQSTIEAARAQLEKGLML